MKPRQFPLFAKPSKEHGGFVRAGKRKVARPLDSKRSLHLVMRAGKARGAWSFLHPRHKGTLHLLLLDTAKRFGIKVYRYENVGNHMHLLIKGRTREELRSFLRVFPQRVMFQVTGACKGNPIGRFFDAVIYSRIVEWGREFKILSDYHWKNAMEALGSLRVDLYLWKELPS